MAEIETSWNPSEEENMAFQESNRRRIALIDKKFSGQPLTEEEQAEYLKLEKDVENFFKPLDDMALEEIKRFKEQLENARKGPSAPRE